MPKKNSKDTYVKNVKLPIKVSQKEIDQLVNDTIRDQLPSIVRKHVDKLLRTWERENIESLHKTFQKQMKNIRILLLNALSLK